MRKILLLLCISMLWVGNGFAVDNTKLLLHLNGVDEATSTNDVYGHTISFEGTAQLDTAEKKFGTASLLLDGNSDYLTSPDSADWDFSGDFTVDCWVNIASTSTNYYIVGNANWSTGSDGWYLFLDNQGRLDFGGMYDSGNWTFRIQASHGMSIDTWTHLAVVRNGSTVTAYVGGVSVGTDTDSTSVTMAGELSIGALPDGSNWWVDGWVDEVRITKGEALWTSNFTPPTEETPDPSTAVFIQSIVWDD